MEKRNQYIAIGVIAIIAVAAGVGSAVYFMGAPGAAGDTVIFGTGAGPAYMDPLDVWDSASFDCLDQLGEGLLGYDLTDPAVPMIPMLATAKGTWSYGNFDQKTNYTIDLKTGITFHDGMPFNATAVKFTFDRLNYYCNSTGEATDDNAAIVTELYKWPNETFILNRTEIVTNTRVKFVLNTFYAVWEPLITFGASYILSPHAYHNNDTYRFDPADDYVVGTGPFKFVSYLEGDELRLTRFDDYRLGPSEIKDVIFTIIEDAQARNTALLTKDINFLADPLPELQKLFDDTPGITLHTGGQGAQIQYVGFNTRALNITWREALSYMIDYDYITDEIMLGTAVRLKSNIPEGIQFSNDTLNCAIFNLTYAREVMQGMGYGFTAGVPWNVTYRHDRSVTWNRKYNLNQVNWTAANFRPSEWTAFHNWNYSYNADNMVRALIGLMLQDDLKLAGIQLTLIGLSWAAFIRTTYGISPYSKDDLCIWFLGWIPDYMDPSNFCNPLFTVRSMTDDTQIDDPYLDDLMAQGLVETNTAQRKLIYDEIQRYVVEELRMYGFSYNSLNIDAYTSDFHMTTNNLMFRIYFYPCYFS